MTVRNHAVADIFEPGSVMKPLTIALALQQRRITPDTVVPTDGGRLRLDGCTIHDDKNFGTLTTRGVIEKSSNVGTTKITLLIPPQDMYRNFRALGLGHSPRAGLPGTSARSVRPWKRWRRIEQATMAYGYGLSASLLQLAQAYTSFANDGRIVPAMIHTRDAHLGAPAGRRVFSMRVAREVCTMMQAVVSKDGTALQAAVPSYSVAGNELVRHRAASGEAVATVGVRLASAGSRRAYASCGSRRSSAATRQPIIASIAPRARPSAQCR